MGMEFINLSESPFEKYAFSNILFWSVSDISARERHVIGILISGILVEKKGLLFKYVHYLNSNIYFVSLLLSYLRDDVCLF